ncbi:MAG: signal peptidase I [Alphaproteobacteria bacterium]|jgi:signal peptidase I|nr:signal peptidase I [Alphaproteobacteria bacterium]MBT4085557.1 signal peptidase I [Alphaproteobacteria bacterium]MBT4544326.1 signal peptidase I [Alphaproteobacteria bacterium]
MVDENKEIVKKTESWGETIRTVFYAVLIAIGIRTFAWEPFNIPSESMLPTLQIGDYLFVSKYAYGYSKHSFPFSMGPFDGRKFESPVKRGDVVVFKLPRDNTTDYIKRIVGLPGDKLQVTNGVLHINGKAVPKIRTDSFPYTSYPYDEQYGIERNFPTYDETLPNGVKYLSYDLAPRGPLDNTDVYEVPAGHYFAMGDNRDNSTDSRVPINQHGVGFVPAENLVGRAEVLFFSTNGSAAWWEIWGWPGSIRWGRLFQSITE